MEEGYQAFEQNIFIQCTHFYYNNFLETLLWLSVCFTKFASKCDTFHGSQINFNFIQDLLSIEMYVGQVKVHPMFVRGSIFITASAQVLLQQGFILCSPEVHSMFIRDSPYAHQRFIPYSPETHSMFTRDSFHVHQRLTLCSSEVHPMFTADSFCIHQRNSFACQL